MCKKETRACQRRTLGGAVHDFLVLFVDQNFAPSSPKSVFVCKKPCFLELEKGVKLFSKLDKLIKELRSIGEHGESGSSSITAFVVPPHAEQAECDPRLPPTPKPQSPQKSEFRILGKHRLHCGNRMQQKRVRVDGGQGSTEMLDRGLSNKAANVVLSTPSHSDRLDYQSEEQSTSTNRNVVFPSQNSVIKVSKCRSSYQVYHVTAFYTLCYIFIVGNPY